jgi:putative flippase GtrA
MILSQGFLRWVKFATVGAIGIVAQLAALGFLHGALGLNYLVATALAVECAILHNFVWHERWTWRDRPSVNRSPAGRLLRFHLSAGLVSMVCNLAGMRVLAGALHAPYLAANLLSIGLSSAANFLAADLFVFRRPAGCR